MDLLYMPELEFDQQLKDTYQRGNNQRINFVGNAKGEILCQTSRSVGV
jgi:hypothetical protein